jgi:hypothetical protein
MWTLASTRGLYDRLAKPLSTIADYHLVSLQIGSRLQRFCWALHAPQQAPTICRRREALIICEVDLSSQDLHDLRTNGSGVLYRTADLAGMHNIE